MSRIESREACPHCRARGKDRHGDNLAVYSDGHKFCYSCLYFIPSSDRAKIMTQEKHEHYTSVTLPQDAAKEIDTEAALWLAKYDITRDEVTEFKLKWSDDKKWLIFPVYGVNHDLLMYQARTFRGAQPKYLTFGSPERVLSIYNQKDKASSHTNLVVVEDMVSAIRISRQFSAMPLWGSSISISKIGRLQFTHCDNLIFWLDYDKRQTSMSLANKARGFGFKSAVIITKQDPKDYSDPEISEFVSPLLYDPTVKPGSSSERSLLAANECAC